MKRKTGCDCITIKGNETYLSITKDEQYQYELRFQNKTFGFYESVDKLERSGGIEIEILPGIYMGCSQESILMRIRNFCAKRKTYVIRNENYKDYFSVKSLLDQSEEEHGRTFYPSCGSTNEYINPQVVEQPTNLGGGHCKGCNVMNYFNRLRIVGERSFGGYCFFSEKEVLEDTKNIEYFRDLCEAWECYDLYNSIVNNGYNDDLPDIDMIYVEYRDGRYIAGEGKHRICALKRFGYDKNIKVRLTRYCENPDSSYTHNYSACYDSSDMDQILEDCYSTYERLGISRDEVRRNLKNPHATVIDYLKSSKYTFDEMYSVCTEMNNWLFM